MQPKDMLAAGSTTSSPLRRVAIVRNAASGTAGSRGDCHQALADATALEHAALTTVDITDDSGPAEIAAALGPQQDLVIVAGGDGTVRAAAEALKSRGIDAPLLPLPCGTVNLHSKLLYPELSPAQVLARLPQRRVTHVPAGYLNGRLFLLSVGVGFPATAASARELLRYGRLEAVPALVSKAISAFEEAGQDQLRISAGGNMAGEHGAALIASPIGIDRLVSPSSSRQQTRGALDCALIRDAGPVDRLGLAVSALRASWRRNPSIETFSSAWLEVVEQRPLSVILDGEPSECQPALNLSFEPAAVPVITLPIE